MIICKKPPTIHSKKNVGPYANSNSEKSEVESPYFISIAYSVDVKIERALVIESKKT